MALDGIIDSMVTFGYRHFLITKEVPDLSSLDSIEIPKIVEEIPMPLHIISNIGTSLQLLTNVLTSRDPQESEEGMVMLFMLMRVFAYNHGIDMNAAVRNILDSNWSKYPEAEGFDEDGLHSECRWIEERRGVAGVTYTITDCGRIIFRDSRGKIMKPSTFIEANMGQFFE